MLTVDIKKRFPGFTLSAQFDAGDGVTALLGASGCGKSVTLRCIAGVIRPDEGAIYSDGVALFDHKRHIDLPPQKRHVGLMFQSYALFPHMTLRENVEAALHAEKDRKKRRARAMALLESFQLSAHSQQYPRELSGGQQQRAALCRIVASEPHTLLLDEPFSALDSHLRWQLERGMAETLARFSGTTLLVTHDRGEAYRLSDHACVMDAGRNEPVQQTRALFAAPRTKTAALLSGCKNIVPIERLDAHRLAVPSWRAELISDAPIPDTARFLGVRAHHLSFSTPDAPNALPVEIVSVTPDLFSCVYTCMAGSGELRVELPLGAPAPKGRACVAVPSDAMMLLE